MIENVSPVIIAIWVIGIILAIAANYLKLHHHFLNWYRLKIQKIKRTDFITKDTSIKILNFHHPITDMQRAKIQEQLNRPVADIIDLYTQLDESRSFQLQLCDLIDKAKISSESLQRGEYIINLPGFAPAAAVLISELHGRMGHFPTIIRMKKVEGITPPVFDVEEIVNLQAIRDEARKHR